MRSVRPPVFPEHGAGGLYSPPGGHIDRCRAVGHPWDHLWWRGSRSTPGALPTFDGYSDTGGGDCGTSELGYSRQRRSVPSAHLETVAHGRLTLPGAFGDGWAVFLAYRGHW